MMQQSIELKVKVNIDAEAAERLAAAQQRLDSALSEFQKAIGEVYEATYSLSDIQTSVVPVSPETTP